MKLKFKPLLLATLLASGNVQAAETTSSFKASLAPESLLLDIDANSTQLLAVGERGHILLSEDGVSWQQQDVPSLATLTAVELLGDKAWAVGHDATILFSADAGKNWQQQQFLPELQKPLLDVLFFDENQGIAIGAYGLFFRTLDGGASWNVEAHPEFLHPDDQLYLEELKAEDESLYQQELQSIMPHLNRVNKVGDTLYLAGEVGLLAKSEDLGRSWQRLDVDYYGSFFDINVAKNGQLLAAGLRGNVFAFDQSSQRWRRVDNASKSSFNSIVPIDEKRTLVLGNNGRILTISEQNTLQQTPEGKAIINAVYFDKRVIAVTGQGIVTLSGE